ncbi:uncharacterized protein zgc:158432 [Electrophorus electricus]|uniref:uncharacterized protein zgc:158432 n=1 Tax=Electrophorus electricus TaxID=8005 RepID=UPI0015D0782C|nr:uncharacterized protein zgc:158432 [Electrophorus electricus]
MAAIASRPYSTSGNMDPVSDRPPSGQPRQPYTYSMTDAVRPVGTEGPLNMPVLGGPQRPYSYTADSGQVLSNPYAKARNPYEDPQPSDRYCRQASFPHAHHGNRTSQFSAFHNAPDYTNSSSAFPRAQLGGI